MNSRAPGITFGFTRVNSILERNKRAVGETFVGREQRAQGMPKRQRSGRSQQLDEKHLDTGVSNRIQRQQGGPECAKNVNFFWVHLFI
ncbi:hypothetical protein NQZ68_030733 [Dissostichus eleginoides]|nr:hypothetical protein NQZ68_030733 [Dissostichus eleginoides]